MRIIVTLTLLISAQAAFSGVLPDLVCQEIKSKSIGLESLSNSDELKTKGLYKFKNGQLFLSGPAREEYLYGKVTEYEFGRYLSGYKSIVFSGKDFKAATVSHHDQTSVVISKLHCSKI